MVGGWSSLHFWTLDISSLKRNRKPQTDPRPSLQCVCLIIMSLLYKLWPCFFAIQFLSVVGSNSCLFCKWKGVVSSESCTLSRPDVFHGTPLWRRSIAQHRSIYTSQLCSNKRPLQSIGKAKEARGKGTWFIFTRAAIYSSLMHAFISSEAA